MKRKVLACSFALILSMAAQQPASASNNSNPQEGSETEVTIQVNRCHGQNSGQLCMWDQFGGMYNGKWEKSSNQSVATEVSMRDWTKVNRYGVNWNDRFDSFYNFGKYCNLKLYRDVGWTGASTDPILLPKKSSSDNINKYAIAKKNYFSSVQWCV